MNCYGFKTIYPYLFRTTLKKALKAEIDEDAWSELYSTSSRPFEPPQGKNGKSGKIAVKVINHYGDEVLKVYEVK